MPTTLKTSARDGSGTRPSRRLRLQGRIPASLQGEGQPGLSLSIDAREFLTARRHHEHVFQLELEGGGSDSAMIRELQWDPLGEEILHVEFRRVDLTRETEAEVELEFVGHPKGGVLNHLVTHVTVAAVPSKIPDRIEVKVDAMELGHPLLASDLKLPEGVRLVTPGNVSIAVVTIVRAEEPVPTAAAAAVPAEGAAEPSAEGAAPAPAPGKGAKAEKGEKPEKPERAERGEKGG